MKYLRDLGQLLEASGQCIQPHQTRSMFQRSYCLEAFHSIHGPITYSVPFFLDPLQLLANRVAVLIAPTSADFALLLHYGLNRARPR